MINMSYNGDEYFTKIASIQQSLHERERRRLELERELFTYCRSDRRISQLKCSKLRRYLGEISDREERAKRRNLELLKDVEHIENSMKKYQSNHDPLRQQKIEAINQISKFMDAKKLNNQEAEAKKVKFVRDQATAFTDSAHTSTELRSIDPKTKDGLTIASSDHKLHSSPLSRLEIHGHLPRGLLKDSRVDQEDAVSNQECLSDNISGSNDPPDGINLRDEHERIAELPTVRAFALNARNVPSLSNQHNPSPPQTLIATAEKQTPCSDGPTGAENPIVKKMDAKESITQSPGKEEKDENGLIPENALGKICLVSPESFEASLSSEMNFTQSRSSALSLSLTQSELDEDSAESEGADEHEFNEETDRHYQLSPKASLHSERSERPMEGFTTEGLSQKGLYKLFDTIERHLHSEQCRVYSNPSISTKELYRLISLCNRGGDLNGEDPTACGAVVLHELPRLSWSTVKGCLLPPDVVNAHQSCTRPHKISACLSPDAAQLWDRWFKHALLLKERSVLSTEHMVQLFTPLLLGRHATHGHQAKVLLRTLLSRSSEECPSAEDESDASSFGPAPHSSAGVVNPLQKQYSPEPQSIEEDSQDESPLESVPIKESKAYLLLKQSAMQKRFPNSTKEENPDEDLSEINDDLQEDQGWAKRPLHQDPYLKTEEVNSKTSSALQSKAFWGESDDSNSEIEAALRPQPFSANNVDTADFYD